MKNTMILTMGVALSVSAAASADFTGFDGETSVNTQGNNVVMMYATFDDSNNVTLNLFDSIINGEFVQNDVQAGTGGTWTPTATLDIPGFSDSGNDSYVTVGYAAGAINSTGLDPNFGGAQGSSIPTGAGWYNGNPNDVQSGDRVLVGQFVFDFALEDFEFFANIGYKADASTTGVEFAAGNWSVPAPGALALLGLGGIVARRRRG
jgi:MYXO-CTERM domain-containing protein